MVHDTRRRRLSAAPGQVRDLSDVDVLVVDRYRSAVSGDRRV
jgi:hypothetical protein